MSWSSGQAFEHVEFFWLTIAGNSQSLKTGGLCCLIAPSGGPEHRYPVDCWRYFPDGFSALARFVSLEVLEVYSQNGTTGYSDGSDMWQDTVLVCRKPVLPKLIFVEKGFQTLPAAQVIEVTYEKGSTQCIFQLEMI